MDGRTRAGWRSLAGGVTSAGLAWNTLRPIPPDSPLSLPSFLAAWLTGEMAPQHLGLQTALALRQASRGAHRTVPGAIAVALHAGAAAGLALSIREAARTDEVVERALVEGLGPDYRRLLGDHVDRQLPWARVLAPFLPAHRELERVRDVVYARAGGRDLRLDVYRRRDLEGQAPVLLHVHGGAWAVGDKNTQGRPVLLHMAVQGWVCLSIDYRLSPWATFPDHVVDVKRAIAWARDEGARYGADPSFVALYGGSAGGHLSALAALTPGLAGLQPGFEEADTRVQAAAPFYGVYDFADRDGIRRSPQMARFLERHVMKASVADDPERYRMASPLDWVNPDAPPFLVVHGALDSMVPVAGARRFVEALRAVSRAPVAYAELPGTQHQFEMFASVRTLHVVHAAERFLTWALARRIGAQRRG